MRTSRLLLVIQASAAAAAMNYPLSDDMKTQALFGYP